MKPHRLALTHSLILNYGLYKKMDVSLHISFTKKWVHLNEHTCTVLLYMYLSDD